jgi:threonine dehydrogenase-like Zn-dependent dehydrogenase
LREDHASASNNLVAVRTLYTGISRGTETLVFNGKIPPGEYTRMRAPHQEGSFPFPVKYGYSAVGLVEEGPDDLIGKTVFALHPHQDIFLLEPQDVHVLPEGLPASRAVLAANMETALNIVWDAQIAPGDRVVVFGAGVVGLLVGYLASRIVGTDVTICDTDPAKSELAEQLGIGFLSPDKLHGEYDCLINASGAANALAQALQLAGFESRVIEASWYGDAEVQIPLGGDFHAKRLSIVGSQVGSLPPNRRARWDPKRRMAKALELLLDERLDCLISGETRFDDLTNHYAAILGTPSTLCHRIIY